MTAILVADVPLRPGNSLVMRLGDWVGWIALVGLGVFHVVDLILSIRANKLVN